MQTRALYLEIRDALKQAGVPDAGFDADALLRHTTGRGRFDSGQVTAAQRQAALALAGRRAKREPLQYLLGSWSFLGLELAVGPGVLIPRPETEEVCLAAFEAVKAAGPVLEILDLCAGSGALALGLQSLLPGAAVTAIERDPAAFAWLERNIACYKQAHPGRAVPRAVMADALDWQAQVAPGALALIVCNPPYVTAVEYDALAPELYHEPRVALVPQDSAEDGLLFYRRITVDYRNRLKPGGWLVYEIGADQGPAVLGMLEGAGYADAEVRRDMAGHPRVALGRHPGTSA